MPLPDALADILTIVFDGHIVQGGLRLEVTHPELDPPVLEPVAQDADQAVVLHRILKGLVEFLLWVGVALLFKSLPLDGLGGFDEAHQGAEIQGHAGVHRGPVICVRGFLPSAGGRDQKGFNVLFKLLFVVGHLCYLLLSVARLRSKYCTILEFFIFVVTTNSLIITKAYSRIHLRLSGYSHIP